MTICQTPNPANKIPVVTFVYDALRHVSVRPRQSKPKPACTALARDY